MWLCKIIRNLSPITDGRAAERGGPEWTQERANRFLHSDGHQAAPDCATFPRSWGTLSLYSIHSALHMFTHRNLSSHLSAQSLLVFRWVTCHGCLVQLRSPSSWYPKAQRASSTWHLQLLLTWLAAILWVPAPNHASWWTWLSQSQLWVVCPVFFSRFTYMTFEALRANVIVVHWKQFDYAGSRS